MADCGRTLGVERLLFFRPIRLTKTPGLPYSPRTAVRYLSWHLETSSATQWEKQTKCSFLFCVRKALGEVTRVSNPQYFRKSLFRQTIGSFCSFAKGKSKASKRQVFDTKVSRPWWNLLPDDATVIGTRMTFDIGSTAVGSCISFVTCYRSLDCHIVTAILGRQQQQKETTNKTMGQTAS